jgi:hypothetical protein
MINVLKVTKLINEQANLEKERKDKKVNFPKSQNGKDVK